MLDNVIFHFFLSVSWYCFPLCQTHHLAVSLQGMPEMSRRGRHSSLSWAVSGQSLQKCPRVEFHWPVWGHVHVLTPITTACLSLAEPGHMCAAEQGGPSGHGLRSREGQFFKENLEGIFKSMRMGCWMGRDTWCQLYFPSLYMAELVHFVPHTLERPSGSCIWLTSFKALPCCGPWASCGGFSPFRSGTYSSGLGHWGDYVPLVSVSSPGMVKWPRKSWWDEIRLLLKLEWKKSFFSKLTFYHENFFPAHPEIEVTVK